MDSLTDPRETSLGLGLRWVSPVGPIRVDVAQSVSEPDEGFRIHFSMGPEL
ncbi:MAG: BamA/TamA family outer membrane protein [Halopseudomonas sp.]